MDIFHRDFERIAIAAPILNESAEQFLEIAELLTEEDFFVDLHQKVFSAGLRVVPRGDGFNIYLVAAQLVRDKVFPDDITARAAIASLTEGIPGKSDLKSEIAGIRERSLTRHLWRLSDQQYKRIENGDSAPEIMEWIDDSLGELRLRFSGSASSVLSSKDAVDELWADLERGWEMGRPTGLTTGLRELDRILQGLQPGSLYVVAGRTGKGKSAFALFLAMNAMAQDEATVLFITLEMTPAEMALRVLSSLSGIDSQAIKQKQLLMPGEMETLALYKKDVERHAIFYGEPGKDLHPGMIRKHAKKFRGKLGLIVVDYLQLVRPQGKHGTREREVAECSQRMKALALELKIPIIILSQLNRAIDRSEDNREPELADLRESGSLEQDANVVMFLHDPEKDSDKRILLIKKNRSGPTGRIPLTFIRSNGRFHENQ